MTDCVVKTRSGKLRGRRRDGIHQFLGVPFAAPPTGVRRWLPPEPPPAWSGVRDALTVGAGAHQDRIDALPDAARLKIDEPQDEDCLFLNLWTPNPSGSLPVMLWIHGGAFSIGSGSQAMYHGRDLCRRDVVLVTVNYRLGPFGFMHLDGPTGGAIAASGNEGLLDQVAALQWVRDNIAAFGGDPGNVTIFGQSAGSQSVAALLSMPVARGLFHKAIMQSAPGHGAMPLDDAVMLAGSMISGLGADPGDAAALRSATPEEVMTACPGMLSSIASGADPYAAISRWARPVLDGKVLSKPLERTLADGGAQGIPLLVGTTRDEAAVPMPGMDQEMLLGFLRMRAPFLSAERLGELVEKYREIRAGRGARVDPAALMSAIMTHKSLYVPATRVLDAQRAHAAVFHYIFDWTTPSGDGALGTPHGVDVGFVFGTRDLGPEYAEFCGRGPAADALSDAMMNAWAAFARRGDPSADGLGDWPPYHEADRPTMRIGGNVHVENAPYEAERLAWDGIGTDRLLEA